MIKMIADYMEQGFLENIIDMFKHDRSLYHYIGYLLSDERMRVRLGVVALVEELNNGYRDEIIRVIPDIAKNLKNENPTIRGDTAYLLGIIGHHDAMPYLEEARDEERNTMVREVMEESIDHIINHSG